MGKALASGVPGRLQPHQAGVEAVLHIAAQDAVLDQHVVGRRRPLVVDRQRAAPVLQRAVVDDRDPGRRDPLAEQAGKGRGLLAVEIALGPWPIASCSMTPGHPGPSTTVISPAGAGTEPRLTRA